MERTNIANRLYAYLNDADNAYADVAVSCSDLKWVFYCPEFRYVLMNAVKGYEWNDNHSSAQGFRDKLFRLLKFWNEREYVISHRFQFKIKTGHLLRIACDLKDIGRHLTLVAIGHYNASFTLAVVSVAQHCINVLKYINSRYTEDAEHWLHAIAEYIKAMLWHTVWMVIDATSFDLLDNDDSQRSVKSAVTCLGISPAEIEELASASPEVSEEWWSTFHAVMRDEREVFYYGV